VLLCSIGISAATPAICPSPTSLVIANMTSSTADLFWNPEGLTSFEIAVQPTGVGSPANGTPISSSSYTATELLPDTTYRFWIRSNCGDGTFSAWSISQEFSTSVTNSLCPAASQCNYIFHATDSFGDSWNGNMMIVYQNGNVVSTIQGPEAGGSVLDKVIPLCDGQPFQLFWGTGGAFASEVGISIENSFGQILYSKPFGTGTQNSMLYSGTVDCNTPACIAPSSILTTSVGFDSVMFSWSGLGASQWEVLVLPDDAPTPTAGMSGISVSTNSYTATGLTTGDTYAIYVRAVCSETSASNWSTPLTVTPSCLAPTGLYADGITNTSATLGWNANGPATEWEIKVWPAGEPTPVSGIITSNNPYTATGLTTGISYSFSIATVCAPGIMSPPVSIQFTPQAYLAPLVTNTTQYTNEQLVNQVLMNNPCMNVTNVTSSTGTNFGSANGIGYFSNTNPTFPLSSGLILSTGNALNAPGPNLTTLSDGAGNWPGDPQLEAIILNGTGTTMDSHNATKLEFDFTSVNEYMNFNFLFASDEYGTFQCNYSDAFAFLLTDLVSGLTTNLAVVPNTSTPISVVTIRDGQFNTGCMSMNPDYFDTYFGEGLQYASATNFNGQTMEMTASSTLLPNHPYHIKLVVADRGDSAFDSAVFIEAGSFAAGPPECNDKIRLVAFIDANANGVKDSGEVDFTYGSFVYQQNNAGDVFNISSPFGTYTIYDSNPTNTYDLGYQINPEYAAFYALGATNYDDVNIPVGSGTQLFYFPVTLSQPYNDVTVTVVPLWSPVPGMNCSNKIVYTNLGIAPASGTLTFSKDALVSLVSVGQSGITTTGTGFTYNFSNLQPYETRTISVYMGVPPVPTVNIGDLLTNSATISAPSGDINLSNNASSVTQTVVASYDPNDIVESHGGKIQFSQFSQNDYLYYTIHFQNTGTANAINVRVEDLLDSHIDETSIRMISASHNYIMERVGNHVVWKFDYIQLPGAVQNEELSKGYVTFQVRLKPGFAVGTIIPSTASIYFDTNPAIITNTFNTEFVALLANADFNQNDVLVYPNPASGSVQVNLQNTAANLESITLYDLVGKVIKKTEHISSAQAAIDVSALSSGIYLLEVTTENQMKLVKKLMIK
jgi:uncharacterized repeat protein (TIGR01451 family)